MDSQTLVSFEEKERQKKIAQLIVERKKFYNAPLFIHNIEQETEKGSGFLAKTHFLLLKERVVWGDLERSSEAITVLYIREESVYQNI